MKKTEIETLDLLSCQIHLGGGTLLTIGELLEDHLKNDHRFFILTDDNTHRHCLPILSSHLPATADEFILAPGESHKSLANAEKIWKWLLDRKAGRNDLLINLGGGVVSDLGGFVASAYKRGMPFMNIPTSLIGMVDASVGGKVSVNLSGAKNQVGSFYHPRSVVIDPVFLQSLPEEHLRNGFAEILKTALLSGEKQWKDATSVPWQKVNDWMPLIKAAVAMKAMIVARDPRDTGIRKILNFGHTLGHAFESCSLENYPPGILHGDAIASGMIGELFISWRQGHICWSEMVGINKFLKSTFPGLPFTNGDKKLLFDIMMKDKKNLAGKIRIATLKKIGEPSWDMECEQETISKAIDYVVKDNAV